MNAASVPPGSPGPSAVISGITALGAFFALEARGPANDLDAGARTDAVRRGPGPEDGAEPSGDADTSAGDAGAGWQPLSAPLLAARVTAVRQWLAAAGGQPGAAVEARVAASVAHLGLAARLVSPALAAAVLYGRPLVFALHDVRWQPVLGAPVPLSLPIDALGEACPDAEALAELLAERLLAGPVEELAAGFGAFGVSRHILRGNTASAVNGAAVMLTRLRPELAAPIRAFTRLLLARAPLAGESVTVNGAFRRRSCCLIYRAAPGGKGGLCGDCALDPRPAAHHREGAGT